MNDFPHILAGGSTAGAKQPVSRAWSEQTVINVIQAMSGSGENVTLANFFVAVISEVPATGGSNMLGVLRLKGKIVSYSRG
ncbi:hypothetical protein [Erwinia psidii]|uniref:Uncharacterized protein n=1 Tax=Erwinia psidii TaxID=69224 RepID=A0A3N6USV5_9GAMM|nr:hypothetical protein [Erwinia psidii]MCX8956114.1 hypothetical protein [Erwinia psidii]MCX8960120.1 hypothetical protein [Erwinia psidii]MCX8963666.1 hypothetical protein [Erwinia psidii]RQM39089.1 hypothetical protein EB241_04835 [Erwinia psidii]